MPERGPVATGGEDRRSVEPGRSESPRLEDAVKGKAIQGGSPTTEHLPHPANGVRGAVRDRQVLWARRAAPGEVEPRRRGTEHSGCAQTKALTTIRISAPSKRMRSRACPDRAHELAVLDVRQRRSLRIRPGMLEQDLLEERGEPDRSRCCPRNERHPRDIRTLERANSAADDDLLRVCRPIFDEPA